MGDVLDEIRRENQNIEFYVPLRFAENRAVYEIMRKKYI
jgi:hypothetical protein